MTSENIPWSEGLQEQTRDAIIEMGVSPHDGKLHFKSRDNRYAFMTIQDLLCGKLFLADKENGEVFEFADVDGLLNAGWAID